MFPQFYSDAFVVNEFWLVSGTATATAARFPDVTTKLVFLVAQSHNIGSFFIGNLAAQSIELNAGDNLGWFSLRNLNELYFHNASGTADRLGIWVQR